MVLDSKNSLNDGIKFKKNQSKIGKKTSKIEGFSVKNDVNDTNSAVHSKIQELAGLQTQLTSLLEKYQSAQTGLMSTTNNYLEDSKTNKFAGKNVGFSNGAIGYVSDLGIFKWFQDPDAYNKTAGKNGCPSVASQINDTGTIDYAKTGSVSTSIPSVKNGSAMISGQSCGNEGKNVFVNTMTNKPSSQYMGVSFGDNTMTKLNNNNKYTYEQCLQSAINSGSSLFALQNIDIDTTTTSVKSDCYIGNNLSDVNKYNKSLQQIHKSNCPKKSDGWWYGNSYANAIYKSAEPSYIGTYVDTPDRAMPTFVNGGSQSFSFQSCYDEAIKSGSKFFGLQNATSPDSAQCFISDDFTSTTKYGRASPSLELKFTSDSDGDGKSKIYGGPWANAIYQTAGNVTYNGCYKDKNEPQRAMNSVNSGSQDFDFKKCQQYALTNKSAYFALQNGEPGTAQCFISNNLNSSTKYGIFAAIEENGSNHYGNSAMDSLAGYKIDNIGNPESMGKIGYVDENSKVSEYPSSMIGKGTNYDKVPNMDSPGNDIVGNPIQQSTVDSCKTSCNANNDCSGFVFDNTTNNCWLKNNAMQKKLLSPYASLDTYIRNNDSIIGSNSSCSKDIVGIDSIQWDNYIKNPNKMTPDTKCGLATAVEEENTKLNTIQQNMDSVASKIVDIMSYLESANVDLNNQMGVNKQALDKNLKKYKLINTEFTTYSSTGNANISNILSDTDILVLQENYSYIFWSILAIAAIIITMNIIRKK